MGFQAPGLGEAQQDGLRKLIGMKVAGFFGFGEPRDEMARANGPAYAQAGEGDFRKTAQQNGVAGFVQTLERGNFRAGVAGQGRTNRFPTTMTPERRAASRMPRRASSGMVVPVGFWKLGVNTMRRGRSFSRMRRSASISIPSGPTGAPMTRAPPRMKALRRPG